jgi:hypothetical protein
MLGSRFLTALAAICFCVASPVTSLAQTVSVENSKSAAGLTALAHRLIDAAMAQGSSLDPAQPTPAESAAAPAAAESVVSAPIPEKVAIGEQIITNLQMVPIMTLGAKKGLLAQPSIQAHTPADRDRLLALVDQEMQKSSGAIVHALAEGNVDRFTITQLNDILALSKIKFIQDTVLSGADPSLVTPDPSSMTPEEKALFIRSNNSPHVNDFLANFNFEPAKPAALAALRAAFQAWSK